MVIPPSANPAASASADDLALLRRVTAFGQELAGTLRRASVIDLLLRHIRESLSPTEIALTLFHRDADARDFVQAWPTGRPDRRPLLQLIEQRGPLILPEGLDPLVTEGDLPPQPDGGGSWLLAPFVARGRITGSVAIRGERGRFGAPSL